MKAPLLLLAAILLVAFIAIGTNVQKASQTASGVPLLPKSVFFASIGVVGGIIVLFFAASVVGVIRRRERIKEWFAGRGVDTTFLLPFVLFVSTMLFLALLVIFVLSFIQKDVPTEPPSASSDEKTEEREEAEQDPGEMFEIPGYTAVETDDGRWRRVMLIALLVSLSTGSIVLAFLAFKSPRRAAQIETDEELGKLGEDLFDAAHRSLETLLNGSDPRLAVIAAYAVMEEAFASHNFRRRPAQTPVEFIAATLSEIRRRSTDKKHKRLPENGLIELTELFEVAKFSTHEIIEKDRESAMKQLKDIQAFLSAERPYV